jgi:uncharacterized membrane protein YgcG
MLAFYPTAGRLASAVSALPALPKVALAAVVCASMWRAFLGAPAPANHRAAARLLLALTAACYAGGAAVVASGADVLGSLLIVAGIEASCVAAWLVRGARDDGGGDDGGGGGGGGGSGPKLPPPIDWEAFDRARRAWERTPTAS